MQFLEGCGSGGEVPDSFEFVLFQGFRSVAVHGGHEGFLVAAFGGFDPHGAAPELG